MASRTCFEVYLSSSTNLFMRNADKWLGIADVGFFRFGSHAASFGREISYLRGDHSTAEKCNAIASGFDAGRSLVSATRVGFPLYRLFTGQMFWKTAEKGRNEMGNRKLKVGNGTRTINISSAIGPISQ